MTLTGKEKAAYGLGAVGKDMVYMLSASYILYYYQDILGVNAVAMGIILLIARVFDAFNDPIMGIIVAKTKTKWGKFRPWLMIGTVLNAVILYLMFACPITLDGKGLIAYAAVTYILWGVTYTMMDIPYWSMIPAFTQGGKQREGLTTLARSCAGVGSALITIVTILVVSFLGKIGHPELQSAIDAGAAEGASDNLKQAAFAAHQKVELYGFKWFALIVAVLFILFITITCMTIKEKSTVDMKSPSVGQMFRALIQNDQAVAAVITIVLINCSLYITSNLLIYFFKYDISGEAWKTGYTIFNTFGGGIQIISMMLFYPLIRRFFKATQVFYISCGMAIGGYGILLIMMMLGINNVYLLLVPGFFIFVAFGMLTVLTTVFLANTVDYGELKNDRRDESVIFSMQTFVVKLASGVAALGASLCLSIFHISSDTEETAAAAGSVAGSSLMGLRLTMTVIPIIGFFVAVLLFAKKYILTEEKIDEITAEIKARRVNEV